MSSSDNSAASRIPALHQVLQSFGSEIGGILSGVQVACDAFGVAHREFLRNRDRFGDKTTWMGMYVAVPLNIIEPDGRFTGVQHIYGSMVNNLTYEAALVEGLRDRLSLALIWGYEAYERALSDLYGALGYVDPDLWLQAPKTARNTKVAEEPSARTLPLEWFKDALHRAADRLQPLQELRKLLPATASREETLN